METALGRSNNKSLQKHSVDSEVAVGPFIYRLSRSPPSLLARLLTLRISQQTGKHKILNHDFSHLICMLTEAGVGRGRREQEESTAGTGGKYGGSRRKVREQEESVQQAPKPHRCLSSTTVTLAQVFVRR